MSFVLNILGFVVPFRCCVSRVIIFGQISQNSVHNDRSLIGWFVRSAATYAVRALSCVFQIQGAKLRADRFSVLLLSIRSPSSSL